MKIGTRTYGGASCEIGFASGVPESRKHDIRLLSNLETSEELRGKGHATELMNRVFKEADRMKVILLVNPDPGEGSPLTLAQLVEWYGRLGFNEIQMEPLLMARMFNAPAVVEKTNRIITGVMK